MRGNPHPSVSNYNRNQIGFVSQTVTETACMTQPSLFWKARMVRIYSLPKLFPESGAHPNSKRFRLKRQLKTLPRPWLKGRSHKNRRGNKFTLISQIWNRCHARNGTKLALNAPFKGQIQNKIEVKLTRKEISSSFSKIGMGWKRKNVIGL